MELMHISFYVDIISIIIIIIIIIITPPLWLSGYCICFDGVVIAAQCTATF